MKKTLEAIAEAIRMSDTWGIEDVKALCDAAGMLSDFEASDGDTFESVVAAAADSLGVKIF